MKIFPEYDRNGRPISPPYQKSSDTSKAAAESMVPSAATIRAQIWHFLRENGPQTADYIENALNIRMQTVSARIWELMRDGWVRDTGERRQTRQGRNARVIEALTQEGKEYV